MTIEVNSHMCMINSCQWWINYWLQKNSQLETIDPVTLVILLELLEYVVVVCTIASSETTNKMVFNWAIYIFQKFSIPTW